MIDHRKNKPSYLAFSIAWWVGWLLIAIAMIIYWERIPFLFKIILTLIEIAAAPDIHDLKIFKDEIKNKLSRS